MFENSVHTKDHSHTNTFQHLCNSFILVAICFCQLVSDSPDSGDAPYASDLMRGFPQFPAAIENIPKLSVCKVSFPSPSCAVGQCPELPPSNIAADAQSFKIEMVEAW